MLGPPKYGEDGEVISKRNDSERLEFGHEKVTTAFSTYVTYARMRLQYGQT